MIDDTFINETAHYTPLRPSLFGLYSLSKSQIPYVQSVLSLREVTSELNLVENLPSDLRAKWSLEELFQREIDWERVDKELLDGYLRRPNKLKFFNSLTVALLPVKANGLLDSEYGEPNAIPALPAGAKVDAYNITNVGAVQLVRRKGGPEGYVRWDSKRIFAATIDGQHRLAALQTLARSGTLSQAQYDTSISVIFLVLDPRAGLILDETLSAGNGNPILRLVREVFIDLNMHARKVVRSREILLNDQEIESVCVRDLLAQRIGEEQADRLPLGLVHWQHKVGAKFNTGSTTAPFITTVELLNLIVKDLLDLQRPNDPLDEKQVRDFVASVEGALGLSKHIAENPLRYRDMPSLSAYVEQHYLREGFEEPFANLPPHYIRAAAGAFEEKWRPLFLRILLDFKPYKDFTARVRELGGIDGDIAFYLALPERAQKQQRDEWGEALPQKLDIPLKELASYKLKDWPFFAVFQKALFRAAKNAHDQYDILPPNKREAPFADAWIQFLDEMFSRDLFEVKCEKEGVHIWTGIGINSETHTVRWSEATVSRLASLLLLWWYFYMNGLSKPGAFLKQLSQQGSSANYPNGKKALEIVSKGIMPVLRGAPRELTEKEKKDLAKKVEAHLKTLIGLARSSSVPEAADTDTDANTEAVIEEAMSQASAEEAA